MFHILIDGSIPDRLVGGSWSAIGGPGKGVENHSSDVAPSTVECGLKGGQIREAIPSQRFKTLLNNGRLKRDRACKKCLQRVGGKYNGKTTESPEA